MISVTYERVLITSIVGKSLTGKRKWKEIKRRPLLPPVSLLLVVFQCWKSVYSTTPKIITCINILKTQAFSVLENRKKCMQIWGLKWNFHVKLAYLKLAYQYKTIYTFAYDIHVCNFNLSVRTDIKMMPVSSISNDRLFFKSLLCKPIVITESDSFLKIGGYHHYVKILMETGPTHML